MKYLQIATALAFATTLAACGGQAGADAPMQLASVTVIESASATPASAPVSTGAGAAPVAPAPAANMPAPDCAAEGCASLRIIDGNAEAWRIDAQRRAAEHAKL